MYALRVLRRRTSQERAVNFIIRALIQFGVLKDDLDYHFIRASMMIVAFLMNDLAHRSIY
jgi:hypothetical protein